MAEHRVVDCLQRIESYSSWREWQQTLQREEGRLKAEWFLKQGWAEGMANSPWAAQCSLCQRSFQFAELKLRPNTNFREELQCPACNINARTRCSLSLLLQDRRAQDLVYLTEQTSTAYIWLKKNFPRSLGSEYCDDEGRRAALSKWLKKSGVDELVNHEDVTRLSHQSGSVDAIGCFEVLEHVPDYRSALLEFRRVLKKGGSMVLTVPFLEQSQNTLVRAKIDEAGNVVHLLEPEFHGDPVRGDTLCFYHFGWDLLDSIRAAGFSSAQWARVWSPQQAIFGEWSVRAIA